MLHFCTLNKRIMEAQRKTQAYATVLVDLVNAQVITRHTAESLLGYKIPNMLLSNAVLAPTDATDEDDN